MDEASCDSTVELNMLARGMAKQHETYQDATLELIDNAVSSVVTDECYFENPDRSVEISINIVRTAETVTTIVADNGLGIPYDILQDHVFRTGNKEQSDGILNNVGWGLKASVAWFEETIRQSRAQPDDPWFSLVTQTPEEGPFIVEGPITGDLPIRTATKTEWQMGVRHEGTTLNEENQGTRVCVECACDRFDTDVWASADRLQTKVQALRERLGVLFRRLLTAHPDNRIVLAYHDFEADTQGTLEVPPIFPTYQTDVDEQSDGTPQQSYTFELTTQSKTYIIEYECGTLDFEAMTEAAAEENPDLLTNGGNFRTRYRPSQATQGIDIYANGRILMTSVFSDLFDLSRNNQYNYFGGIIRIIPTEPQSTEVPTDNKKTRIDTNSELWRQLQERLSKEKYQPEGKRYNTAESNEISNASETALAAGAVEDSEELSTTEPPNTATAPNEAAQPIDGEEYGLINADSRHLADHLSYFDTDYLDENLVDVTITSPPYADMKNYGYSSDAQIGLEDNYGEYLSELQDIFAQVYDITKPNGSLWVVINTFKKDGKMTQLPSDIARVCQQLKGIPNCPNCSSENQVVPLVPQATGRQYACRSCGQISTGAETSWLLQDIIVWDKTRALPYSETRFRNVFEYVLCFSKQPDFRFDLDSVRVTDHSKFKSWWVDYPERYHPKGIVPANIWSMTTPSQGAFGDGVLDHPAPFPPALVERIVNLTTSEGNVVFDPFAGSGTVLAQAEAMNRRPIGFELSSDYCETYEAIKQHFAEQWTAPDGASHTDRQIELSQTIGRLRQVKQVRELLRRLADAQGASEPINLDIESAIHIEEAFEFDAIGDGQFIETSVVLIIDEGVTPKRAATLEEAATKLLVEKPLSGYGIAATPYAMTKPELQTAVADGEFPALHEDLFVYANGRHYEFTDTVPFDTWVTQGVSGCSTWQQSPSIQPVLSHIKLEVSNPRRESEDDSVNNDVSQSVSEQSSSAEHRTAAQPDASDDD